MDGCGQDPMQGLVLVLLLRLLLLIEVHHALGRGTSFCRCGFSASHPCEEGAKAGAGRAQHSAPPPRPAQAPLRCWQAAGKAWLCGCTPVSSQGGQQHARRAMEQLLLGWRLLLMATGVSRSLRLLGSRADGTLLGARPSKQGQAGSFADRASRRCLSLPSCPPARCPFTRPPPLPRLLLRRPPGSCAARRSSAAALPAAEMRRWRRAPCEPRQPCAAQSGWAAAAW